MIVLGLDLETQSLEPHTKITEIGARLVNWSESTSAGRIFDRVDQMSEYCYEDEYEPQTQEIIELTGITDSMLKHGGNPRRHVLKNKLFPLMERAEVIFAHRTEFDKTILENTCKELGIIMPKREWVCTYSEIDWAPKYTSKRLQHLCIDHLMHFNPKEGHRALYDVDLMLDLIAHYKLDDILAFAREPWVIYKACIRPPWEGNGGDGGVQRNIASKLGFSYEKLKYDNNYFFAKTWIKKTKASKLPAIMASIDASESPFEVEVLEGGK